MKAVRRNMFDNKTKHITAIRDNMFDDKTEYTVTVRNSMFETNSSSCHSIIKKKDTKEPNNMRLTKSGVLKVPLMECYDDGRQYDEQIDKLSYLLTLCFAQFEAEGCEGSDFRRVKRQVDDYEDFVDIIEQDLKKYIPGMTKLEIISSDWKVDHNSVMRPGDFLGDIEPMDFIFDPNLVLETD